MAFDKPTRNRLASFVAEARRLITDEFTQQFQSLYGISDGSLTELAQLGHLDDAGLAVAGLLRERIDYLVKTHPEDKDGLKAAVARLAREQAFTVLNRLAAVRMAEKRGLIAESVGNGYQSKGFKVFEQVARSGLGEIYQRYRRYLFCLFDELAIDLGVLFDRRSPQGLLFPRENTLLDLLNLLNGPELEPLWQEDETIGWIYQYYNDPAERKKMREESAAPRNSRELAVRNQFFTPRYVVEFLTDNTLGRIWYEMTRGETRLAEQCRYLVRRPTEIFLGPEETAPELPEQEGLSQEELLRQPVYIPHRSLKDPRQLRMLDPACGSMHFGLYAFDLYEVIYEEAWNRGMESLHSDFPERDTLLHEIPRLIIEHNIHGIDIDPRAVQIAGLSLWLRAQRSWQQQRLPARQRPQIRRSNIVCAEPMPGDMAMLREFIASQFAPEEQPAFTFLMERVFDRMALAGEAGSLLKIEEEISEAVREAKGLWKKGPQYRPGYLFAESMPKNPQQLRLDLSGIPDEHFWGTAEDRIYEALRAYADQAESDSYQRRLFADDAAHGFAFIDICRKHYDVMVMNPPFGEPVPNTAQLLNTSYKDSKADVDAAFVDRARDLLEPEGLLGGIYNRTQFFKGYLSAWRDRNLLKSRQITNCIDLGLGVLDGAMVEAAAYTTHKGLTDASAVFISVLSHTDKDRAVSTAYVSLAEGRVGEGTWVLPLADLTQLPAHRISYWVAPRLLTAFEHHPALEGNFGFARQGLITSDNARFLRLIWEIPSEAIGRSLRECSESGDGGTYLRPWAPYAKGGDYSPFFGDVHLAVNWGGAGQEICNFFKDGQLASRPQNLGFYFRKALTYTERTASDFSPRVMPEGCIFDCKGPIVAPANDDTDLLGLLATTNSSVFKYFVELSLAGGDSSVSVGAARQFTQSIVGCVPVPSELWTCSSELRKLAAEIWHLFAQEDSLVETSRFFVTPTLIKWNAELSLHLATLKADYERDSRLLEVLTKTDALEDAVAELYHLDDASRREVETVCGQHPYQFQANSFKNLDSNEQSRLLTSPVEETIAALRQRGNVGRAITKMSFYADRRLEVLAHAYSTDPREIIARKRELKVVDVRLFPDTVSEVLSYAFGTAFGRWDTRYATGELPAPELPDPFARLPICPPGMLQGEDGLPLSPEAGRQLYVTSHYPLDIAWDGFLVDDPGHPLDLEHRLREVFTVLWGDRAEVIEQEACEIFGVKSVRDYFRKPSGFFADHLKRYSKSRRQAPIYWPLSSAKGSYTLWIYYHRLSDQTLHTALADFVDPKIKDVRAEISLLRESNNNRSRLEELLDLESELLDFQAEIERIIKLPWQPNLNDGVLITAAPLWRLFRLPKWQKDLKACWDKLEIGEYDWAHLAYSIWPKRVEDVCKKDRSIAIAHGLEHRCQVEPPKPKAKRGRKKAE